MIKYIILGITQGITEFFPVSSSGHLLFIQKIFGFTGEELVISIVLHLATILAVAVFFYRDILLALQDKKAILAIALVTFITGVIGIAGKEIFENLFSSIKYLTLAWIISGVVILLTKCFMSGKRNTVTLKDSLILGITQGLAIVPGISRSGITVSTLLFRGLDIKRSFSFSFIVSLPAILGAAALEAQKIDFSLKANFLNLGLGFVFSFITGLLSLWLLRKILARAKFHYFGYYCIFMGLLSYILILSGIIRS